MGLDDKRTIRLDAIDRDMADAVEIAPSLSRLMEELNVLVSLFQPGDSRPLLPMNFLSFKSLMEIELRKHEIIP